MRIAVIGLGSIGQRHVRNFESLGCDVLTYDAAIHAAFPDGLGETIQGADGVVIATPPQTHTELAWEVLGAGASVMIEKPVSTEETDLGHLFKAYEVAGLTHMVAYPWRYHPETVAFVDAIREAPGRLEGSYGYDTPNQTALAMGPILDCSHIIDLLRWGLGHVVDVTAHAEKRWADLLLRFESGASGHLHLGWDTELRRECWVGPNAWIDNGPANNAMYLAEAQRFLDCIAGKEKPLTDGWDGRETLRVCLAAQRAARERRWIAR